MSNPKPRQDPEIEHIHYDAQERILHVIYKDGAGGIENRGWSYQYNDVPAHLYEGLKRSDAPHDYLKAQIESVCGKGIGMLCLKRLMSAKEGREHIERVRQFERENPTP